MKKTIKTIDSQGFDLSIFEVVDGMVNLTKICKFFNKRLDHWLKTENTKRFFEAYSRITPNGGIRIIRGDSSVLEQGTFADRKIAIKLAEWISVDFEIWANEKLDVLLQTGKVEITKPKSTLDMLKLAVSELEAAEKEIKYLEQKRSEAVDNSIENLTLRAMQTKTGIKALKEDIGAEINRLVNLLTEEISDFRQKHVTMQSKYNRQAAYGYIYTGAKTTSLDGKEQYLKWLREEEKQLKYGR